MSEDVLKSAIEEMPRGATASLISNLLERAKELKCLYRIEEILNVPTRSLDEVLQEITEAMPPGWQYPKKCDAEILCNHKVYRSSGFRKPVHSIAADIRMDGTKVGEIRVSYHDEMPPAEHGPFLHEEVKLIQTVASRIGHFMLHQNLQEMFVNQMAPKPLQPDQATPEWKVAIDLLCNTDQNLLERVTRKMMNRLLWRASDQAEALLKQYGRDIRRDGYLDESNKPRSKRTQQSLASLSEHTFKIASEHFAEKEILEFIQGCLHEDKMSLLIKPLLNVHASLSDITDAMQRYQHLKPKGIELSEAASNSMRVALIRRFLTEQLDFIKIAKSHVVPDDFFDLVERLIYPKGSHGKLGGKSAGLFLGTRVLRSVGDEPDVVGEIKTPKTWYITSEGLHEFVYYNNLEEFYEQKYKTIGEVRQDYPHIVQIFKSSHFPKEMVKGISAALDDLGEVPLIVRSSSLLEDRVGAAFCGKYRSLFLANQGDKRERLDALLDAIAEVYASTFGPDPIEYRAERGLLDFNEQMAIMIQTVVGRRVGDYFFPSFAGVAFSNNDFCWSPRIKRSDGLLRMVPGLGTRAVDRLTDDYPLLVSIGQPDIRVNVTDEDRARYSPKYIDAINLKKNCFETLPIKTLLRQVGSRYPAVDRVVSVLKDGIMRGPAGLMTDFDNDDAVVTFDGLLSDGRFIKRVEAVLSHLVTALGTPVDIEFACDDEDFYLLQCRPLSYFREADPVRLSKNIPVKNTLFTANRYITNGRVSNITHLVYVDPSRYSALSTADDLNAVGRAVGQLNKALPHKRFILIGPGRWGSRGDIRLGVHVTYSDINNTAMLVEVARKRGDYMPELSFGTHFFQDLVEASIRYLPLYPDDDDVLLNERFLLSAPNVLSELSPDSAHLSDVIRVIDIVDATDGRVLNVLMSAEQNRAVGMFSKPSTNHQHHFPKGVS